MRIRKGKGAKMKGAIRRFLGLLFCAAWAGLAAPAARAANWNDYYQTGEKARLACDYPKALQAFAAGLKLAVQANNDQARGSFLCGIGIVYDDLGQYDKALSYLEQDLAIRRKIKDVKGEGADLTNIGVVYCRLGQYDKALAYDNQALAIDRKTGDAAGEGADLTNIGIVYVDLGQYDKARSYYEQGLAIHRKTGSIMFEGAALSNLGVVCWYLGQYDKALSYYEKAIAIRRKIGDVKGEGTDLGNIGMVCRDLSQYDKALKYYEQALAIQRRIGDVEGEGDSLYNIGSVCRDLGQYDKAIEYYEQDLAINRKAGDVKEEGADLSSIGVVCEHLGQYDKALKYYEQALEIARRVGNVYGEAKAMSHVGAVYEDLGQYDKALAHHEQALAIERKIGNVPGEEGDLCNIGVVYGDLGQYDKALSCFEQALAIDRRIGDIGGEGRNLNNMGWTLLRSGKFEEAKQRLEAAADVYESIRGQIKGEEERAGFQSTLPAVYGSLAAARIEQGRTQKAFESIERGRAKSFLDLLAAGAAGRRRPEKTDQAVQLQQELGGVRKQRVELAMQPAGEKTRSAGALLDSRISEIDKQRLDLIDQMRRSDPERGALVAVDAPKWEDIRSLIPPGAALIEYFHYGAHVVKGEKRDRLWIFVARSEGLDFRPVEVSNSELTKTLESCAQLFESSGSKEAEVRQAAARLYGLLIQPVETCLNADTLIVVPWGSMFKIPFASLAPEGGEPLGARKNVVMAPSAGVYRYLLKKRASGRKSVFAVGNPETPLAPLAGAEREAKEIAALFKQSAVKTGAEATESLIKEGYDKLGKPDVAHFACHGIFNEQAPQLSHLALTPDRANDGNLEMHEIFDLDWKGVSLVTMSACSSGRGKLGTGDDLVGLTRGFMFAGAPSVLCSLWDVDDEATRALMVAFYKNYLGGMGKPQALREAQRSIRENPGHPEWSHPYYWAAFTLWGDWE